MLHYSFRSWKSEKSNFTWVFMFSRRRKEEKDSKCETYFDLVWRSNSHFSNSNWNDYVILNSFRIGTMKENEEKHDFRIIAYIELVVKCAGMHWFWNIVYSSLLYIQTNNFDSEGC